MGYRIGSFNVRNLSDDNGVNLKVIAQIIKRCNIDIIALQEVLDSGQILNGGMGRNVSGKAKAYQNYLLSMLPGYDMRWGASNIKKSINNTGDRRGEGYAFIWNTKRIDLAKTVTPNGERVFNPRIWSQYSLIRADGKQRLIRDPFYGRFKIKGMNQEIRLITTHIRFGSEIRARRDELNILAGAVYPRLHDKTYGVNTPATTLLLGDYNMSLLADPTKPKMSAVIIVDENGYVRNASEIKTNNNIRTFTSTQYQLSTVSSKGKDEIYSSNYDHFTYETSFGGNHRAHDGDVLSNPRALTVKELPVDIDFEEYRDKVSDHIPIVVELSYR